VTDIFKVQAVWTGFLGGPGVNTFYVGDTPTDVTNFHDFYAAIANGIPAGISVQVLNSGISISRETGELTGAWTCLPAQAPVVGTAAGAYPAGSGAVVRWDTGAIVNRRRVRGHTFLVPLGPSNYDTSGRLSVGAAAAIEAAALTLAADLGTACGVWSRPAPGRAGSFHTMPVASVPRTVAELRSRRD
jgi:hypothetical protein